MMTAGGWEWVRAHGDLRKSNRHNRYTPMAGAGDELCAISGEKLGIPIGDIVVMRR